MKFVFILIFFLGIHAYPQSTSPDVKAALVDQLLDSLVVNPTSFFNKDDTNWRILCNNLQHVDMQKLNQITASIYSGTNAMIENKSTSSEGFLGKLNKKSNRKRLKKFNKKITKDFNNRTLFPNNKIVLVEGDSWFEYPLFLKDITDNLMKQDNLAVFSLASGGDWAANMIASAAYQDKYLQLKPDVFIMSGGGNDLLENERILNLITDEPIDADSPFLKDYREYVVLRQNKKAVPMCNAKFCPIQYHTFDDSMSAFTAQLDTVMLNKIVNGRRYINKDFYRFLVSFKLEYKILFESLHKMDPLHFDSLKIITQGYDYALPNSRRRFGIQLLIENGIWLKKPLETHGITDPYTQESIIMAMIFDFNEMLIELGKEYPNIYHVDVRGFNHFLETSRNKRKGRYWYDELHPTKRVFAEIAKTYVAIINDDIPKNKRVVSVIR